MDGFENAQIKDYTKDGYEVQPEVYGTKSIRMHLRRKSKKPWIKCSRNLTFPWKAVMKTKVKEEDDVFQDALDTLNNIPR